MSDDKGLTIEEIAAVIRERIDGFRDMTEAQRETARVLVESYLADRAKEGLLTLPLNDVAFLPGNAPGEVILRWRLCPPADYVEIGVEEVEAPACQSQDWFDNVREETP